MAEFKWTDEADDIVRDMRMESISSVKIAKQLSSTYNVIITRNMVLGNANRKGMPIAPKRFNPAMSRKKRQRTRTTPKRTYTPVAEPAPMLSPPKSHAKTLPPKVSFKDLGHNQCRYIPGEPAGLGTLFCGRPVHKHNLCKEHHGLCRQPLFKRR